jgi:histidine triad (HIT) family protein
MIAKEIPTKVAYENPDILAFHDINPKAPTHILIIPKKHIATINDVTEEDNLVLGKIVNTAKNLAKEYKLADDGYRLVYNCNRNAGQAVYHIHMHLLGGRHFTWPPG